MAFKGFEKQFGELLKQKDDIKNKLKELEKERGEVKKEIPWGKKFDIILVDAKFQHTSGLIGLNRDIILALIKILIIFRMPRKQIQTLVGIGLEIYLWVKRIKKVIYDTFATLTAKFIAPVLVDSVSSVEPSGLIGHVHGQFGFLAVDPPVFNGITRCTFSFVENRGFCRIGIAAVSSSNRLGNLDEDGSVAFDNMGNIVHPGKDTISSKRGWRRRTAVSLEVNMDTHSMCILVDNQLHTYQRVNARGQREGPPVCLSVVGLPKWIRFYTWNVNPSTVEIVSFERLLRGTALLDNVQIVEW